MKEEKETIDFELITRHPPDTVGMQVGMQATCVSELHTWLPGDARTHCLLLSISYYHVVVNTFRSN